VWFNRRHQRAGHLFQNRYKSIVCEEDQYFLELARYIHLNPLRSDVVENLEELDRYRWSGHGVLIGKVRHDWQEKEYVLNQFGGGERQSVRAYRKFIEEGKGLGRRPELVGGGLVRSLGGWSKVLSLRNRGEETEHDSRVWGSGEFSHCKGDKETKLRRPKIVIVVNYVPVPAAGRALSRPRSVPDRRDPLPG
jgi:hypothetical protein